MCLLTFFSDAITEHRQTQILQTLDKGKCSLIPPPFLSTYSCRGGEQLSYCVSPSSFLPSTSPFSSLLLPSPPFAFPYSSLVSSSFFLLLLFFPSSSLLSFSFHSSSPLPLFFCSPSLLILFPPLPPNSCRGGEQSSHCLPDLCLHRRCLGLHGWARRNQGWSSCQPLLENCFQPT